MKNSGKFASALIGVVALMALIPAATSAQEVFDGYFGSGEIFDGYFGSGEISDGYFGGGEISDGYFGSGEIFDGYFGSGEVYDGYFGSGEVYDGYFGSGEVYDGYFGSGDIFDGYFGSGTIQDGYFGSGEISDGYFGSGTIQDGYFGSGTIQDGYFGTGTIQDGYLGTGTITDGYIGGCGSSCAQYYNEACGCYEVLYERGYSMPFSSPMTIVPPRYTTPSYPSYPSYPTPPRPTPPAPQPPRPTPTQPSTPINIVNTNNNVNTNTNTNVTTVTPVTPGPIVQYVAPQYPYYQNYVPNYNQAPYCTITVSQQGYQSGMVWLSWSSSGATSAYISPIVGQVAPNGSTSIYAYGNNIYSLTVSGPGGTYTCRTQSYVTPVSPYVSLTQIPYTGLSLGPIGNAIYWMSLMALAVAGAYLLVYYKGGMFALATSLMKRSENVEEDVTAATPEVKASHLELPTENTSMTRDALRIVRSEDGTPRLVISRA